MAERYATQRRRKDSRRRSLPRLSDEAPIALHDRERDDTSDAPVDPADVASAAPASPASIRERRPPQQALPRRSLPVSRRGLVAPTPTVTHVDYSYVKRDLRRIAIIAVVMLALLIVLNMGIQHFVLQ